MNEETMAATRHEKLQRSEPIYAHLLGGFRAEQGNTAATPERELKVLKARIKKCGDRLEREASAHGNDLRRLGREAHEALLDLAGFTLDRDNLLDVSGRLVASVDTIVKVDA